MCLGVPGKVVEIFKEEDLLMGKIEYNGVFKNACLEHVPDVEVGEFVVVHVGFALNKLDEEEANKIYKFLEEINGLDEIET